jgi:hypothetical protein
MGGVRFGVVFFLLPLLAACKAPEHDGAGVEASPQAPAALATLTPPGVEPVKVGATIVTFTKATLLDECTEVAIELPPTADAGAASDFLEKLVDNIMKGMKQGASRIYKGCTEQFRTNPVLATCTVSTEVKGDSGAAEIMITERFYDLDTITTSDSYMKQCIEVKGDWQAVDHDSQEYREAVRARSRREVEKAQRILQR